MNPQGSFQPQSQPQSAPPTPYAVGPVDGQPPAIPIGGLAPGDGLIRVNIQGNVMVSMIVPTLLIDGHTFPSRYGENAIPVPAGRHQIALHANWMRQYGQAEQLVDVPPGAAVDVFYAAPWHQFTRGSIGFARQSRRGVGCLILMFVPALLILLAALGAGFFTALAG